MPCENSPFSFDVDVGVVSVLAEPNQKVMHEIATPQKYVQNICGIKHN